MQICPPDPPKRERQSSIIEIKNKIRLGHDSSCNCYCCCNPQSKCYKYVQPKVPKSFAPIKYYWKPDVPMEKDTTYRVSFWEGRTAPVEPFHPENSLTVGDGRMSDETTHKMSYLGNWCVKPESKVVPCQRQLLGKGPMQDVTTQKHDFTWKALPKLQSFKSRQNLYCPTASMADDTTYKSSFFNSNCRVPVKSYKPIKKYEKSDVPMEGYTTYKLSFWPSEMPPKEEQPWNVKSEYHPPVIPMEGCTTYKLSYWPNYEKPRKPFTLKESDNLLNASCCFDGNTTYKLSFFGCGGDKPDPIKQPENDIFSRCPVSHDTTHKLSYLGNWCIKPEAPILPRSRDLLGKGPMQDVTTQKHDYSWKYNTPSSGLRPEDNLTVSPLPLESCTINKLSYVMNDLKSLVPNKSYKPVRVYQASDVPMENETTMRLSYQPVEMPVQVEKPWASKNSYHPPTTPIEDNTTYNLSYIPPGTLHPLSPCSPPCPPMNNPCELPPTTQKCQPCIPCGSS